MRETREKLNEKGITLVALVVTIVVLLILAGVTLSMLVGENGIITKAKEARDKMAEAQHNDQLALNEMEGWLNKLLGDNSNSTEEPPTEPEQPEEPEPPKDVTPPQITITVPETKITSNSFTINAIATDTESGIAKIEYSNNGGTSYVAPNPENSTSYTFNGLNSDTKYYVKAKATDNSGNVATSETIEVTTLKESISKTESYVGYYADIDGNGTVDGIIYADLAKGNTGDGNWYGDGDEDGNYTIPVIQGVKDYYISQEEYKGKFGTRHVLSPMGEGEDRFYVMALKDIDGRQNGTYYDWYNAAYGKMNDYSTYTSVNFGTGKTNTNKMISKWDAKGYGGKDQCPDHKDIWGQIKNEVTKGWFLPSRAEWSAFAEELGITKTNYVNFGLSDWYLSSSQHNECDVWLALFDEGEVNQYPSEERPLCAFEYNFLIL